LLGSQRCSSSPSAGCGRTPRRGGKQLVLAPFFSPSNVDVGIVRIAPFLLKLVALLREATLIEAFAVGQMFSEISVHLASNLFDLDYGALYRLLVSKGTFCKLRRSLITWSIPSFSKNRLS
jgi:hypothetical protein